MQQESTNQTLIDVRTVEEFNIAHIEGAINIPLEQLQDRINEVKSLKTPVIAYCRSGYRSGLAVSILQRNGLPDAINGGSINDVKRFLK